MAKFRAKRVVKVIKGISNLEKNGKIVLQKPGHDKKSTQFGLNSPSFISFDYFVYQNFLATISAIFEETVALFSVFNPKQIVETTLPSSLFVTLFLMFQPGECAAIPGLDGQDDVHNAIFGGIGCG